MRHIILTFVLTCMISSVFSQVRYFDERYISTLSFLNPVLINPGATGTAGTHQVIVNYKNKWASFPGTPKTFLVSYDGPVADRLGLGVMFISDTNGSLETSKVQGSLSYTIDSPTNQISGGLSGEYIRHDLSGDVPTHRYIDQGDGIINERLLGNGFFDVSIGFQGTYNGQVTYGVALPSIVSSRLDDNSNDMIDRELGYIVNIGYKYSKAGLDAVFEPSLFVKKLNYVPFHADINLLGRFVDDKFRGGIIYTIKGDERVGFILGMDFNAMSINYGYNASRHEFQTYNNGSHEFSLKFDIGRGSNDTAEDVMEMKDTKQMREPMIETINN